MVMLLQIRMVEEMVEMDVLLVEVARLEVALMLKEVQHPLVVEHRMCESVELLPQIEWLLQGAVAALVRPLGANANGIAANSTWVGSVDQLNQIA
jgi:hypothetical protein